MKYVSNFIATVKRKKFSDRKVHLMQINNMKIGTFSHNHLRHGCKMGTERTAGDP